MTAGKYAPKARQRHSECRDPGAGARRQTDEGQAVGAGDVQVLAPVSDPLDSHVGVQHMGEDG